MLLWIFFAVTVVVDSFNEPVCERYCSGRTGWHRRLHAAHVVDADPDGLFARYGLRSGAPLPILWGRMVAANRTNDDDIAIFAFLRDNPCLYRRHVFLYVFVLIPFRSFSVAFGGKISSDWNPCGKI